MTSKYINKYDQAIFDAVLKTVSDGITVISKDLKIIFQNEAMKRNFGQQIGEYCYEVYRGREEACEDWIFLEVLKDGKPRRALRDVQMPDGKILWAGGTIRIGSNDRPEYSICQRRLFPACLKEHGSRKTDPDNEPVKQ